MKTPPLVFLLLCYMNIVLSQNTYKTAVIGFYNFENYYDTIFHGSYDDVSFTPDGSKAYTSAVFNDKVAKLASVISQIGVSVTKDGPAILGCSEVENKYVLDTLLHHPLLASRKYRYVHYDSKDYRGVDVAFIYNPKYFKVEKSRPLFVQIPEHTKDAVFTRDILWVTGRLDEERVHIFVNHWPSRYGGEKRSEPARVAAALTVRKRIDSLLIIEPAAKIIVMGDLNDEPVNDSVVKGLRAKGNKGLIEQDDLYNPWMEMYKNGRGTLAYRDSWSLFDQIILSSSFLDKKQSGFFFYKNDVFKTQHMIEHTGKYKGYPMRFYSGDTYRGGYSDHFPAFVVLVKKTRQP